MLLQLFNALPLIQSNKQQAGGESHSDVHKNDEKEVVPHTCRNDNQKLCGMYGEQEENTVQQVLILKEDIQGEFGRFALSLVLP